MRVGDIVAHPDMCAREGRMLQHGMNFCPQKQHSVLLMSRRRGAPYNDRIEDEGRTLIYEGHDVPRTRGIRDPKHHDQPLTTRGGRLTPNGLFHKAAQQFKEGDCEARLVRVYEKIKAGIWTYNGVFRLVDSWIERIGHRNVLKLRLELTDQELPTAYSAHPDLEHNRLIPAQVKQIVYKRDRGRCVRCGSNDNLHFDHDLPFSLGGTSLLPENIKLLCARHNLEKSNRLE